MQDAEKKKYLQQLLPFASVVTLLFNLVLSLCCKDKFSTCIKSKNCTNLQ